MRLEERPLLSLLESGELPPVDAAALYALPSALLDAGRTWTLLVGMGGPRWTHLIETELGRIALVALPLLDGELYSNREQTARMALSGLDLAGRLGARHASMVGLLSSATSFGRAVAALAGGRRGLPALTTGHCTTAASVVMAVDRVLKEAARPINRERVGFLGLGSIGEATLRLLLRRKPHPAELALCDVRGERLERLSRDLPGELGFRGRLRLLRSTGEVPAEFYGSSLIVGATNVPGILDVARLRPGTIVVDDSFPLCFSPARAWERMEKAGDVLLVEGGALSPVKAPRETRYLPRELRMIPAAAGLRAALERPDRPPRIGSCILSALLSSRFEDLEAQLGEASASEAARHYDRLAEARVTSPPPWLGDRPLPKKVLTRFYSRKARSQRPTAPTSGRSKDG